MMLSRFILITTALCVAMTYAWPSLSERKVPMLKVALARNQNNLSPLVWMPKPDSTDRAAVASRGEMEILALWNTTKFGQSIFDGDAGDFVGYEYHRPGYTLQDINPHKNASGFSIYANTEGPHQILIAACCTISIRNIKFIEAHIS
jgi:hypothetical protein